MPIIKTKGYVLFQHIEGIGKVKVKAQTDVIGYYATIKDLHFAHRNELDDKWDLEHRNKIHYFYLNCSINMYQPLYKWVNGYDYHQRFYPCAKQKLSTKTF